MQHYKCRMIDKGALIDVIYLNFSIEESRYHTNYLKKNWFRNCYEAARSQEIKVEHMVVYIYIYTGRRNMLQSQLFRV